MFQPNYIICHDQEIILEYLSNQNYNHFNYLFVGNKNTDKIKHIKKIIICRNLPNNIEKYPYLCSFTAWYCAARNNILNSTKCSFLEYDSEILSNSFFTSTIQNDQIICYDITLFNHYVFYKSTPWLEISLQKTYNIDLKSFVNQHKNTYKFWPTTTNISLSSDTLKRFVDWFLPMTKVFRHDPLGAYVHERAFFIFCILHGIKVRYIPNMVKHKQSGSHSIADCYGSFLRSKNTNYLHEGMLKEYDVLYDQVDKRCKEEN
jgi:hypothetical protein